MKMNVTSGPRPWLRPRSAAWISAACLAGAAASVQVEYSALNWSQPRSEDASTTGTALREPVDKAKFPELARLDTHTARFRNDIGTAAPNMLEMDHVIGQFPAATREVVRKRAEKGSARSYLVDAADMMGTYTAPGSAQRDRAIEAIRAASRQIITLNGDPDLVSAYTKTFGELGNLRSNPRKRAMLSARTISQ